MNLILFGEDAVCTLNQVRRACDPRFILRELIENVVEVQHEVAALGDHSFCPDVYRYSRQSLLARVQRRQVTELNGGWGPDPEFSEFVPQLALRHHEALFVAYLDLEFRSELCA